MKSAIVGAISILLGGCASLPPILQRWADLEIATAHLMRQGSKTNEQLLFYQDGTAEVSWIGSDTTRVRWRVRGAWLEIDTKNDRTYKMRLRALTWTKGRIVAVSPTGERSVWRDDRAVVVIQMVPKRPGLWMP
jgi:hypothetical protein